MKVYLSGRDSLAFFDRKADPDYWDEHWSGTDLRKFITSHQGNGFIVPPVLKYLPDKEGLILEGGCGRGQFVYCLQRNGYRAVGIDFAERTVNAVKAAVPELDVRLGDVRKLPFADGEIAGYWSLGVIEHFWGGYDAILDEMGRVLRSSRGFLFLTFPYMSPLRRLKAALCMYPRRFRETEIESFYQFCLSHRKVLEDLRRRGFVLRELRPFDGLKGFKDEVPFLRPALQAVYDGRVGTGRISGKLTAILNRVLSLFSGHGMLMILEKVRPQRHRATESILRR